MEYTEKSYVDYYQNARPEMLEFIPENATKVIEIGSSEGRFLQLIRKRQGAEIWGVEPNQEACSKLQANVDHAIHSTAEESFAVLPENYFDCFIYNDVLEHLLWPEQVIIQTLAHLAPGGFIVCSIPNVRHWDNIKELLVKRDWEYKSLGTLDYTHFRFYTQKSIIRMFQKCGLEVVKIKGINPVQSKLLNFLRFLKKSSFEDMRYLQFAVVCQKK